MMIDQIIEKIAQREIANIETAKLCKIESVQGSTVSVTPTGLKDGQAYPVVPGIMVLGTADYSEKIGSMALVVFLDKGLSQGVIVGVIA